MTLEEIMKLLRQHPGNDEKYDAANITADSSSPLKDKKIIYLGSSVTFGFASFEQSFVEFIDAYEGTKSVKEAVSGTTLVTSEPNNYIERMEKLDKDIKADAFICQLSTNDATKNKPLGLITEEGEPYNTETILGAIEYVIDYARRTWNCPVYFYTGTYYDSVLYADMVEGLKQIADKWEIGIINLWDDEELRSVSKEDYALYMADPIHPTRAGYREWWTPVFIKYLRQNMKS